MININSKQRALFFIILSLLVINTQAQTGLNFQGVARTSNNIILASQAISIKLSILQGSSTGTAEYTETRKVKTNAQGLFTAVIGDTGAITTLGNFATINWKLTPKFLKIEMDPAAGNNFITMGTTQFQYVAFAQFAKSVDADNIVGIVPVGLGGTGVNNLAGLKTALTMDKVNNTSDLTKPISIATQTALDLKLNIADTSKYTKQTYSDSALSTKLSITGNAATATSATTAGTATKLATARNINGVSFDGGSDITIGADAGTLAGTTLKSTITGSSLTSVGTLSNLTVTNPISGSITGNAATATSATTAGTATKLATARNINGVSFDGGSDITIGADAGTLAGTTLKSTITGSSLTSVGTLSNLTVTNPISGSITGNAATATSATTAGTATKLATARNINGVSFDGGSDITIGADAGTLAGTTLKSTITGSSLTSVGTITSGVWNGTPLAISNGGTGLTSAGLNGQILTSTGSGTLTWTTFSNGTHYIGETFGGGIVFYVYDEGKHGLIAATNDQSSGIKFHNGPNTITRARADGIGAGLNNTTIIIAYQGHYDGSSFASTICNEYSVTETKNGISTTYGGWYLPSKYELNLLYLKKDVVAGFANSNYWSSTEYLNPLNPDWGTTWYQSFSNGDQLFNTPSQFYLECRVRAIRAF